MVIIYGWRHLISHTLQNMSAMQDGKICHSSVSKCFAPVLFCSKITLLHSALLQECPHPIRSPYTQMCCFPVHEGILHVLCCKCLNKVVFITLNDAQQVIPLPWFVSCILYLYCLSKEGCCFFSQFLLLWLLL